MLIKTVIKYLIFDQCIENFWLPFSNILKTQQKPDFFSKIISIDRSLIFHNCYIINTFSEITWDVDDGDIEDDEEQLEETVYNTILYEKIEKLSSHYYDDDNCFTADLYANCEEKLADIERSEFNFIR